MGFIKSYKYLDNLCRDMNGIGVTGYIKDMEDTPSGEFHVFGWKQDYLLLKHYRYIRNQIAHENYADEENMCSSEDTAWLDNFYARIMNQTDPLALYYKATNCHPYTKSVQTAPPRNASDTSSSYRQYQKARKPAGCVSMLLAFLVVITVLILLFFL